MRRRRAVPTLFVTGTDTGVGKTAVGSALAALVRRRGRNVGVMKPIATGCTELGGRLVSADGLCLARAAGADDSHELICPVRFRLPLAPMAAAELEHRAIDLSCVWDALARLSAAHDCLIVEGIGGIMVPITAEYAVADLAVEFGAPLLVVARAALGTINHAVLTVGCARARGLSVAAVLLNSAAGAAGGLAEATNPAVIARLIGPVPVLGPLPWCGDAAVEDGELGSLSAKLAVLDGIERLIDDFLAA